MASQMYHQNQVPTNTCLYILLVILLYYCTWLNLRDRPQPAGLHSAFGLNHLAVFLLIIYMCMFGTDFRRYLYSLRAIFSLRSLSYLADPSWSSL